MKYLVTGGAGFIGSNLVEALVNRGDSVRVLDNFSTGKKENLAKFINQIEFIEGDIRNYHVVREAVFEIDAILHQAALPSVPRSIRDPITTNDVNVNGTLNILYAARDANVKRVVFASSSSIYGDTPELPKHERMNPNPLSPYAVSKLAGEKYCNVFFSVYGLETVALRYFNVFGPKQNPNGPYAAVIPLFIKSALKNTRPVINGDGTITRDFTPVRNVVQINLKALLSTHDVPFHHVLNVACGQSLKLIDLWNLIKKITGTEIEPIHNEIRAGDVLFSLADVSKAKTILGYEPDMDLKANLESTVKYYTNSELD